MVTSLSDITPIVMKSMEYYEFCDEWKSVWHIILKPTFRACRVTRKEAMHFIREHGLVLKLQKGKEEIYDTPNGAFKKKYKGFNISRMKVDCETSNINYQLNRFK